MRKTTSLLLLLLTILLLLSLTISAASAQEQPKVRAILFYSPTCPHCEYVITEVLIPMLDQYGSQIIILGIDISSQTGSELFMATVEETGFPMDQAGVPFLVVADQVMVGSGQIPDEFPGLVEEAFAGDGIAWPDYPSIQNFLLTQGFINAEGQDITPTPMPATPTVESAADEGAVSEGAADTTASAPDPTAADKPEPAPTQEPAEPELILVTDEQAPDNLWGTLVFRFSHDPTANTIAVAVLLILIGVAVYIAINFMRAAELKQWPDWVLVVLLVIGRGIAIYLASAEAGGGEVVCGPVGDCNAVQQSKYATLFGVLPVAVLGIIGYVMIGGSWLIGKKTQGQLQFYAKLAMFFSALFGLLFFIYLTFLEPFVIGATCAWCISSALIMAGINLFTLPVVLHAWANLEGEDDEYLDEE
ncbi:MAG: vitamin K epoxide reductase family protein [Anaerolineales bacterium]